jgi:hypothetical protein
LSSIDRVRITQFADEASATEAARRLVERGIGVEVVEVDDGIPANLVTGERSANAFAVEVVAVDEARAREILGVPTVRVEDRAGDESGESLDQPEVYQWFGGRLKFTSRQAVGALVVYLVLLVAIPLTVFAVTKWLVEPATHEPPRISSPEDVPPLPTTQPPTTISTPASPPTAPSSATTSTPTTTPAFTPTSTVSGG